MPYISTERLPGETIVIVTFVGVITVQDVIDSQEDTNRLLVQIDAEGVKQHVAILIDLSQAETSFTETLKILRETQRESGITFSGIDQWEMGFVGTQAMFKLYVQARGQQQFGGLQAPLFPTLQDALAAMRAAVQPHNQHPDTQSSPPMLVEES